jgi:hypothetical protein
MWTVLSLTLAAGVAVDAGVSAVSRTSVLGENASAGVSPLQQQLSITPQLRGVLGDDGVVLDASYQPQLSVLVPSQDVLLLLHQARANVEWQINPRWQTTWDLQGAAGDLDAGTALRTIPLARSAPVGEGLTSLSFGQTVLNGQVSHQLSARWQLRTTTRSEFTASPGTDGQLGLPPQLRHDVGQAITFVLGPNDALTGLVQVRSGVVQSNGQQPRGRAFGEAFIGTQPQLSHQHTLWRGLVLDTDVGALQAVVDDGKQRGLNLVWMPLVQQRLSWSANLGAASAVEGSVVAGLLPFSSAFGGLLEERAQVTARVAWRIDRNWSTSATASMFGIIAGVGGTPISEAAQNAANLNAAVVWQISDELALNGSVLAQSRLITARFGRPEEIRNDYSAVVGLTWTHNVWRVGARPEGTDARAGRNVAVRPLQLVGRRDVRGFRQNGDEKDIQAGGKVREEVSSLRIEGVGQLRDGVGGTLRDDVGGRVLGLKSDEDKAKEAASTLSKARDARAKDVQKKEGRKPRTAGPSTTTPPPAPLAPTTSTTPTPSSSTKNPK